MKMLKLSKVLKEGKINKKTTNLYDIFGVLLFIY